MTSANVVGYAGSDLNVGNKRALVTPMFGTVGNTDKAIRMGDLMPVSDSSVGMGRVQVSTLNESGVADQTFIWNGAKWLRSGKDANDDLIPSGKGLWVFCSMGATQPTRLQSAGEVSNEDILIRLKGDNKRTALGNGFPVAIKLADIIPEAVTPGQTVGMGRVQVSTLNDSGVSELTYIWNGSKWLRSGKDANEETIAAGKGLWVFCSVVEATTLVDLRLKNPIK